MLWQRVVDAFCRYCGDFQEEEVEPYQAGEADPAQLLNTMLGYLAKVYSVRDVDPRKVNPMRFLAIETEGLWDHPLTIGKLVEKIKKLEDKKEKEKIQNVKRAA